MFLSEILVQTQRSVFS